MRDANALDSADLPVSAASTAGATANSLGDCSMADLQRGYCPCPPYAMGAASDYDGGFDGDSYGPVAPQGFLGQANPYDRERP